MKKLTKKEKEFVPHLQEIKRLAGIKNTEILALYVPGGGGVVG